MLNILLCLVTPPRVWIVVYPRVPRELVGPGEAFRAAREATGMRLLSCVRANVSCLMLQTVESLVAQRALVRSRQILTVLLVRTPDHLRHHADGRHLRVSLRLLDLSESLSRQ
jgi:hypothetical protein